MCASRTSLSEIIPPANCWRQNSSTTKPNRRRLLLLGVLAKASFQLRSLSLQKLYALQNAEADPKEYRELDEYLFAKTLGLMSEDMETRDFEEASSGRRAEEMAEDEAEEEPEAEDCDDEEGEEGLEAAEYEYYLQAVGEMDPLGFPEEDASDLQPHQLFERSDYEALASKKRKLLKDGRR